MDIFIARINHRHGTDLYPGVTQADVDKGVQEYVHENWNVSDHGEEPADAAAAVTAYFQAESEGGMDPEYLEIDSYPLAGAIK